MGFERAGMKLLWQIENDKNCKVLLDKYYPHVQNHGDITNVKKEKLKPVDLICGGFPCQDLSVAGRRAGLGGSRSGLWWEFARIIEGLHPRWVVIENVPGLLSSGKDENGEPQKGRDMGILTGKLAELGYWWAYRVLDSQYYGVAQRRRRVFIVGHLTEPTYPIKVLFESESCERNSPPSREKRKVSLPLTATGVGAGRTGNERNELDFCIPEIVGTLDGGGSGRSWPGTTVQSISAGHAFIQNNGRAHETDIAPTLDVKSKVGIRRLTPVECERLQGFPDNYTEGHSDTARYRMLGNAVTVPVIEWLGKRIMEVNK